MSETSQETTMFKPIKEQKNVSEVICEVSAALKEKGYDPIAQLAGYLLSGDPTYITSYKDARMKVRHFERYELLEELINKYLQADK